MSKAKSNRAAVTGTTRDTHEDGFMANLRQALEHIGDAEWLRHHAPLDTLWTLTSAPVPSALPVPSTGIKPLDDRLLDVWQDWESRPKTPLQSLLWSAARQVKPDKDANHPALLLLTYFQDPRPKQADLIGQLAVSQSTFYRQLGTAVAALEQAVITHLQPSLRLESPATHAQPLIGREVLLQECLAALRAGGLVNLIGASGLGKTTLASALANAWRNPQAGVFWYTIRPGLTDNTQYLIYSLALFLHQHGASNLWLHLAAKPSEIGPGKAIAMIRKALEDLRAAPPLFCFDEADLLLPNELDDDEARQHMRAFLEDLAESPRSGAPLLLVGQRLLMAPERGSVFGVSRFDAAETRAVLERAGLTVDDTALHAITSYTRGNPLLLHLLMALHQLGEPVAAQVSLLASTVSLDWFVARLRRHLSAKELELLDALCVFDAPAPASLWRKQTKVVERLAQLNLIERTATNSLGLPPALREAFYRRLPAEARETLHLSAAERCSEQGAFTLAARHWVLGRQPEMAIWTWHNHRDSEIAQGQSQTALGILEPLRFAPLDTEHDQRALALVLADLYHLLGKHGDGLAALDGVSWPAERPSTARAHELRAKLVAMRGDIDQALTHYRAGLDALSTLAPAKPVSLRVEMARQAHARARDVALATREATLAKHDAEVLLGEIEEESGQLDAARARYLEALAAARASNDPVRLAKACESLGILEARQLNVEAAQTYLAEAGRHYQSYGNIVCAIGMTQSNMAFAFMMARRYADAVAPLQQAIAYFDDANQPYYLALNEANLAEAYMNLDKMAQAEPLALRALAREETIVRPQCLYVLGAVRCSQRRWQEAAAYCQDAINTATANGDPWAEAFAWRVLGDVQRDWGNPTEARNAFERAQAGFTALGLHDDAAAAHANLAGL